MPPFKYMITWRRVTWPTGVELWLRGPAVLLFPVVIPALMVWRLVRLMAGGWKYGLMVRF